MRIESKEGQTGSQRGLVLPRPCPGRVGLKEWLGHCLRTHLNTVTLLKAPVAQLKVISEGEPFALFHLIMFREAYMRQIFLK